MVEHSSQILASEEKATTSANSLNFFTNKQCQAIHCLNKKASFSVGKQHLNLYLGQKWPKDFSPYNIADQ